MSDVANDLSRMLLAELVDLQLPRAQLRARYPHAALVLEPYQESTSGPVDTPTPPEGFAETVAASRLTLASVFPGGLPLLSAEVAWLIKSDRNPFTGMITLGRAGNNDVVIADPGVSKLHAILREVQPGRWQVEDCGSTNGTALEGVRLPARQARELNEGSRLTLGFGVSARLFEAPSLWSLCDLLQGAPAFDGGRA